MNPHKAAEVLSHVKHLYRATPPPSDYPSALMKAAYAAGVCVDYETATIVANTFKAASPHKGTSAELLAAAFREAKQP